MFFRLALDEDDDTAFSLDGDSGEPPPPVSDAAAASSIEEKVDI